MTYGRRVTQIQNTEFCGWVFVSNYSTKHNSKEIKTPRLILVRKRVSEKVNMIDVNRVFKSIILCQMLRKVYSNL